jgi:hypothetical protein
LIIVKLIGGLGNQMFQYAAGKALATKHGVPLKVDVRDLEKDSGGDYTQRRFELNVFRATVHVAAEHDLSTFAPEPESSWKRKFKQLFPNLFSHVVINERGSHYQTRFEKFPANTYLNGYWQNEKYFLSIRSTLLAEFIPANPLPAELQPILEKIKGVNAVSFHVRRGDYVSLASAREFHGVCDANYYQKALAYIQEKEKQVEVMVFSDDIAWCRQHIKSNVPVHYIEHQQHAVWDLYLMSCCKHNVIANSSFSWWAAWLNTHSNNTVVAPAYWFAKTRSRDLGILPPQWHVIE